jgi:hypothetical protein
MRLRPILPLVILTVGVLGADIPAIPSASWLIDEVRTLSAPEMEGRASGTPGAERAARHIAEVFQRAGLKAGGDGSTYFQAFPVPTGLRLGTTNTLSILAPAARSLALGRDFTPLAISADGREDADLVFAGYGITAPELGYDDYAGLDARGKIVLVLTGEPRGADPASPFRRPEAYHYSERSHKIINAREHGARGVLLVAHPAGGSDQLPTLRGLSQPWGILAASVVRRAADRLLASAGKTLAQSVEAIDRAGTPRSYPVPGTRIRLEVSLVRERGTALNVIGVLPGRDSALADQAIVVGAHYDHLGRGGEGSLAPDQVGAIHPGADDNASGTAAVMGLARAFAGAGGAPRTLVFVAFAGEEMGLLGSGHYVRQPVLPLARTALMLNLDMIGRLRDGKLYVAGVDSGKGLREIVTAAGGAGLDLQLRGDPYAPSDHTAFYGAGLPVIFLFTGAHADYHRPSDTWDKLNPTGLETVTAFAARLVAAVAGEARPPAYVRLEAPPSPAGGAGYGPFFGVIPEFGENARPGVPISGVRAGSPAEKAGVKAGDVIVMFGGVTVKNLEDLTFALRGKRPGDQVEVRVFRNGAEHRLNAVLEERR